MSRGRNFPNVNASLIREGRMIFQQLFGGGRVDNYYAMRAAEAQAKAMQTPALQCAFCVDVAKRPNPAVTIMAGYAVCDRHGSLMRDDNFTAILAQIRDSEVRR